MLKHILDLVFFFFFYPGKLILRIYISYVTKIETYKLCDHFLELMSLSKLESPLELEFYGENHNIYFSSF